MADTIPVMDFLQRHIWLTFGGALALGIFVPGPAVNHQEFIAPLIMWVFFLTCAKLNLNTITRHIKKPAPVIAYVAVIMGLLPMALYFGASLVDSQLAVAVLLLSAMPPGAAVPALTDLFGGRASLSLVVTLVSSLIAPLTIPLLFAFCTGHSLDLDPLGMFVSLVVICVLPLALAQLTRRIAPRLITKTQHHYGGVSLLCISAVIYIATAGQAHAILSHPTEILSFLGWSYLLFVVLQAAGYFLGSRSDKKDRIALTISSGYMNNALAIGLAASFFGPYITLLMVLSEIPWSTTVGPLQFVLKRLP